VPVLTGELEEHIVADVAWAAAPYIDWTGDQAFAAGPGRALIVHTARWWASRIEREENGRAHIRGVIGPDEYHAPVDDNAFTNVMARWNLRRAAQTTAQTVDKGERRRWLQVADTIADGYDPATRLYEQFAGFHNLEPLLIADVAPQRPVAADLLLGRGRTRRAQVIKQADVLILHYMVPDEVAGGSLEPNLEFYEPRTAHGSTLSPGVHAALLARVGRLEEAVEMPRLTARIDLDDVGDMTAGGLHVAAMGSVWRAVAFGFAGLRPVVDALAFGPVIPPAWASLELHVLFRESRVRIRIRPGAVEATARPSLRALNPAGERVELAGTGQIFELSPRSRSDQRPSCWLQSRPMRARRPCSSPRAPSRSCSTGPLSLWMCRRTPPRVRGRWPPPRARASEHLARILVPLEGSSESSRALEEMVQLAHRRQLEILVLHVHSPATVPAFFDHEPHATRA
jgi:trehalose/maltose hydrolase-like predicted phosphorylase